MDNQTVSQAQLTQALRENNQLLIEQFKSFFPTKSELKDNNQNLIDQFKTIFPTKTEMVDALEKLENRMNRKYTKTLNTLDKVMGELKIIREEQIAHSSQHQDINDKFEHFQLIS
jgi:hypothetical protein